MGALRKILSINVLEIGLLVKFKLIADSLTFKHYVFPHYFPEVFPDTFHCNYHYEV